MNTSLQLAFGMTLFAAACCLLVTSLPLDPGAETAVWIAAFISTWNGVCAVVLSHIGANRPSTKAFFGAIFGGMVLRMGTTLAGFGVGLKMLLLPAAPFAAALLTFTALFTAAEVLVWSRQSFSPRVQLS